MYWKYLYWTQGISTKQFYAESMKDIEDVIDIHNAIEEKQIRLKNIKSMRCDM